MVDTPPAATAQIATVDIAPINVGVPIGPSGTTELPALQSATKLTLAQAAVDELGKRSFAVGKVLSRGKQSTADATLYINSGAYVPLPYLADDTFSDALAHEQTPYQNNTNAGFAIASCGDDASCAIARTGDASAAQVTSFCHGDLACSTTLGATLDDNGARSNDAGRETVEVTNSNDKVVTPDEPPAMYVGLTLVDNKTGAVIWRAHTTSAANATHRTEVASTVHSVFASLPAR
jgi:hypothetical protein